jgi:hypothetical protein
MGRDTQNTDPNKAILEQIEQLKAELKTPRRNRLAFGLCVATAIILGLFMIAGLNSSTDANQQNGQAADQASADQSPSTPQNARIITTKFTDLLGEFDGNEIAAARKYANARIRTKDYISSISQDSEGAYASLDGNIEAYGPADRLATLHRGDEVQVTCNSASKSVFLHLKDCTFEVLHPEDDLDSETAFMAMHLDGNGGAAVALINRDEARKPATAAQTDRSDSQ